MNERTGEDALGLALRFLFRSRLDGGSGLSLPLLSGSRLLLAYWLSDGLGFGSSLGLGFGSRLGLFFFLKAVAFEEALHAASRVHYTVLAREEGMTAAAHLHVQARLGGAGLEGVAAGADNGRFYIFRMDIRLHRRPQLLLGT
jgi:hypothetical protein